MTRDQLAIATSTVWVILAAILVMFMQAGFAFLEAGLTRMKNVGHIAAKNVLIFALASVIYFAVGYGLAFGDGGNSFVGGSGFMPSTEAQVLHDAAPGHRRLDLVTGMGHAYGTRGLEPICNAVAWCLGVPVPELNVR